MEGSHSFGRFRSRCASMKRNLPTAEMGTANTTYDVGLALAFRRRTSGAMRMPCVLSVALPDRGSWASHLACLVLLLALCLDGLRLDGLRLDGRRYGRGLRVRRRTVALLRVAIEYDSFTE